MDHPIQEESSSLPKVIAFTILGSNYRLYQSGTDDVGLFDTSPPSSAQTLSYPQKADGSIDKMWSGCESSVSPPQKPSSQSSLLNNSVVHVSSNIPFVILSLLSLLRMESFGCIPPQIIQNGYVCLVEQRNLQDGTNPVISVNVLLICDELTYG